MTKITKMPVGQVNVILGELYVRRRKFDTRGLIDTKEVFKAIRSSYNCVGKMDEGELKATINFMVACGYLSFKNRDGYLQFFVEFKGLVTNEHGKVIGVRW